MCAGLGIAVYRTFATGQISGDRQDIGTTYLKQSSSRVPGFNSRVLPSYETKTEDVEADDGINYVQVNASRHGGTPRLELQNAGLGNSNSDSAQKIFPGQVAVLQSLLYRLCTSNHVAVLERTGFFDHACTLACVLLITSGNVNQGR